MIETFETFIASKKVSQCRAITIPADASLEVLGKNTSIYLEEGDKITALASAAGDLEIIVSYEEIS